MSLGGSSDEAEPVPVLSPGAIFYSQDPREDRAIKLLEPVTIKAWKVQNIVSGRITTVREDQLTKGFRSAK